jgi:Tol biopolymer transport system component
MPNFKLFKLLCLTGLLALSASSILACAGPVAEYKPSSAAGLIAFTTDRDQIPHIYTISPDGTNLRPLSSENQTADGLPRWSPDGSRVAFSSSRSGNYEIWVMNADGSDRKKLTQRPSWDGLPRWSPDGTKIVFTGEVRDEEGVSNFEIFSINSDGSNLRQLTDTLSLKTHAESSSEGAGQSHRERISWNSVPTWSPDGSLILFSTNRDGEGVTPTLYTMNPDGSNQKKFGLFMDADGSDPDWSPVTNKIVWTRGTAAKGDIWVMDASSPFAMLTAKKITNNIDDNRHPVWSPDGKQIAFVSDANGNTDIYIMNADGANMHRLTYGKSNNVNPAWR